MKSRATPPLTLVMQLQDLRAHGFEGELRGRRLVCRRSVKPTSLSASRRVRIEYTLKKYPEVHVEDPPLQTREDQAGIPHTYPGPRPCLFWPAGREWQPSDRISRTILPWLLEWLAFYEIWLQTGEWLGGGIPHTAQGEQAPTHEKAD